MHNSTPPKAEKEALDLLRSINDLVTQEARPPGIRIGSAHHTLHLAFEDIELIARVTIAWHRTHSAGICPDCPENQPWYCYRV